MPGPAPKSADKRRRQNAMPGEVLLPRAGRKGKPPAWPLPGAKRAGEASVWTQLWATPQAVAWERLGWVRTVARYCRALVDAEKPDAPVALLAEVRQMEDRLGLTPMAMRRLVWKVDDRDDIAAAAATKTAAAKKSTRSRLKVVDLDAVARS